MRTCLFALLVAAVATGACRKKEPPPASPAQLAEALHEAVVAGRLGRLYALLDERSRWSLMSIYRDRRQACELVRAHYPERQQARELSRCRLALLHPDAESYFGAYAKQHRQQIIVPLERLRQGVKVEQVGDRATVVAGDVELAACKIEGTWTHCGLRDLLEDAKLKAARDLETVRENVETYRERR